MLRYAAKRTLLAVAIAATALALLFAMIHSVPGDPASVMLGPRASPEMRAALAERMGLDKPLVVQIGLFFGGALRGDLGVDVFSNRPVAAIVGEQLPYTLELIAAAMAWAGILGTLLGCHAAARRNSLSDRLLGFLSVGVIAVPAFVVALYALLLFSIKLRWLPAIGAGEPGDFASRASHLVLPALAVGLGWVGYIARLVRATMLEILDEAHIRTAKAFGLPPRRIVYTYALRVAALPAITVLGVGIGIMLSSAVFVEVVFARPGLGKLLIDSVMTRNYPVVMGAVFAGTFLFVAATTASDIINALLDPRVRDSL